MDKMPSIRRGILMVLFAIFFVIFSFGNYPLHPSDVGPSESAFHPPQFVLANQSHPYFTPLTELMKNADHILYNRVPKCGSTATLKVLFIMARKPNKKFNLTRSRIYHKERMSDVQSRILINKINSKKPISLFERHVHFLDFKQYNSTNPLYMNIVRKPVERFISEYYFHRFEHRKPMSHERRNQTFDECVFQNKAECQTKGAFVIIPFFCGQDKICATPSREALIKAKQNVDKYYGVVGLTEDLLRTYALLEQTSPQLFVNMTEIAKNLFNKKVINKTKKKPKPSTAAVKEMTSRLKLENEFYEFIKNRFNSFLKYYKTEPFLQSVLSKIKTKQSVKKKPKQKTN